MSVDKSTALFKEIAKSKNLKLSVLYTYDLSKQNKSKKVLFVYLLKGRRGEKGIISELKGKFIAPSCFILPIKSDEEMQEIFAKWEIKFTRRLMLTD